MVFPLYDDNPFQRAAVPYVTWSLMGINIVVFLAMIAGSEESQMAAILSYGAVPASLTHAMADRSAWSVATLFTSLFLHGGWEHILGNMIYLWVFGDDIEDAFGPVRFLVFYLAAGATATLLYVGFNPDSPIPLVGASGAISGVLAAYLMLRPCAKVSIFVFRIVVRWPAYIVIGGWIALQLFNIVAETNDGVAYTAHFGGLISGGLLFLAIRPAGVKLFDCPEDSKQEHR